MADKIPTSNDLIDDLVRQIFHVEPDVMARVAHGDAQVRHRRPPGVPETTDPLDGVEVLMRRVVATCLRMRTHAGPISLVTERQAERAGWPTAHLANTVILLAWGLFLETQSSMAMPVLLAADEIATGANPLISVDRDLPPLQKLLEDLRRSSHVDAAARDRADRARQSAPALEGRKLVSLHDYLKCWLGVDADTVDILADHHGPKVVGRNARAAFYISCLPIEALEMGQVMAEEWTMAVRLKTEQDALHARLPGAVMCNFVLFLGAAINHGSGCTVHFLPPSDEVAAALVEAGQRIQTRGQSEDETETLDLLALEDLARRGYVHIGRRAAMRVAQRLYDRCTRPAVRMATAVDGAA